MSVPNAALSGTVVGVAPAGMGPSAGPPPGPPAPGMGGPSFGGGAADPSGGMNPGGLGGTMAIDAMPGAGAPGGFPGDPSQAQGGYGGGYGGPPPGGGGYGGPPGGGGYGGPPPGGGGYGGPPGGGGYGGPPGGAPPGGFGGPPGGAPPGGFGGPPGGGGFGGPPGGAPPGGFGGPPGGAPPGGGFGAPAQEFGAQVGQFGQQAMGMMQANMGGPMGPVGARPQRRNPLMVILIPAALVIGGQIVGGVLSALIDPLVGIVGSLIALVGVVLGLITCVKMLGELKNFTGDPDFNWWFIFVPCLQYYFAWVKVPEQVTKAKQMAGVQAPTRSIILYIFLFQYALAADLNDIAGCRRHATHLDVEPKPSRKRRLRRFVAATLSAVTTATTATARSWMPAPTTPVRRAVRLAIWFSPLIAATLLHLPVCPYAIMLREPCPGCGITRAFRALAHLDLDLAMVMNPLAPLVVPLASWLAIEAAILYVLRGTTKLNEPLRRNVGIAICLALFVVWVMRKYFGAFGGPVPV